MSVMPLTIFFAHDLAVVGIFGHVHVIDMRGGGRGNFSYPGLAHFVKVERAGVCECDKKCRQ